MKPNASPQALRHMERIAAYIRSVVGEEDEDLLELIDNETDILRLADALLERRVEANAAAAVSKQVAAAWRERARAMEGRIARDSGVLLTILGILQETRVRRPLGTFYRVDGRNKVEVTDPSEIPSQLNRVKTEPDLTAIKAQLEAGETVPGARLVKTDPSAAVRS